MVIIRALVLATRAMACKAQAIRAMTCMEATRAMACKATQITAYMEESAAIRDMVGTAVTQAAAMEALRELEAIRACTMKMMDITTIITIIMMEKIIFITIIMMEKIIFITIIMMEKIIFITIITMLERIIITITMMVIMATITTIWATGEKTVINKEDDDKKRTLLQIKSVFLAFFLTVQSGNW
ncbi:hypothetical protein DI05_18860 [Bacillus subtilis]|nr:hypothetical protein DI05_18860 [Bacillus subtilis]